jgi:hypothetical protein
VQRLGHWNRHHDGRREHRDGHDDLQQRRVLDQDADHVRLERQRGRDVTGDVTGTLKITPAGSITLEVTAKANGFVDGDFYGLLVNANGGTVLVSKTSPNITYTPLDVCGDTCIQATFTF